MQTPRAERDPPSLQFRGDAVASRSSARLQAKEIKTVDACSCVLVESMAAARHPPFPRSAGASWLSSSSFNPLRITAVQNRGMGRRRDALCPSSSRRSSSPQSWGRHFAPRKRETLIRLSRRTTRCAARTACGLALGGAARRSRRRQRRSRPARAHCSVGRGAPRRRIDASPPIDEHSVSAGADATHEAPARQGVELGVVDRTMTVMRPHDASLQAIRRSGFRAARPRPHEMRRARVDERAAAGAIVSAMEQADDNRRSCLPSLAHPSPPRSRDCTPTVLERTNCPRRRFSKRRRANRAAGRRLVGSPKSSCKADSRRLACGSRLGAGAAAYADRRTRWRRA